MSFLITRRPEKLFDGTVKFSRWTAAHNPYMFEFTRSDFSVFNTLIRPAYNATLPTVWVNADPTVLPTIVSAGDNIYLNSGVYNGVYEVLSISGQYVTLNTPHIGNGGSGRINLVDVITNYKAEISIYDRVTDNIIDTVYPKPDGTGLLEYDASGIIRSIINTRFTANQTNINVPNKDISGGFYISYGATYTVVTAGSSIDVTIPQTTDNALYYWVSAAKQITGDSSGMSGIGQNMKEYVPKNISGSDAKFLTMFERPTYFEGFPFTLSFLYDEDFSENYLERHQQGIDVNGNNSGAETNDTLFVTGRYYVNQMKVVSPTTDFKVWLEVGGVIEGGYVTVGGIASGSTSEFAEPYQERTGA